MSNVTSQPAPERAASKNKDDPLRSAWRKSYAGLAAISVFSVFINIFKLATPLYVLQILDRVIASRSLETLFMLTAITLLAIVCGIILEVIRRRMFIHWGNWIEHSFGPTLFTAGLKRDISQSPASARMLRDVGTIRSFISGTGLIAWLDIIWAPIFIGCVFLISPPLAYILLIGCLIALVLGSLNELFTRDSRDATYKARKHDREWVALAERSRETIGSLNMMTNFAHRWSHSAFARLAEGMRTQILNVYFISALRLVGRFLRIGILAVGIWLVIDQVHALGAVIAAAILARTAYSLVQNAMLKWREMVTAKKAYGQFKASLLKDHTPQVSVPKTITPLPLFIENVNYRYPHQASSVFRGMDLTVNPGEVLFVIGASASGKTTLCKLASGLLAPRSGNIRLGDVDIFRLQRNSMRQDIGHLPQIVTLFPGTVRENIASMAKGDIDQVVRAAKLAGIHQTILNLPEGYDTQITDNEPLLSSGQRKLIAMARAFYNLPSLIILDEPISHLDFSARSALKNAIKQLKSEGTIVIVTAQSLSRSKLADKVILLKGKKHEVLPTPEKIAARLRQRSHTRRKKSSRTRRSKNRSNTSGKKITVATVTAIDAIEP